MTARPLAGIGVLVTRPARQADELIRAVEARGGRVHAFPVIDIVPRAAADIAADAKALRPPDIVIFVSANAVRYGLSAFAGNDAQFAAVGPATAAAVASAGGHADIVPSAGYDSEHLLAEDSLKHVAGKTVTIVRGQSGRELLAETLRHRGAHVQYLSVYRREKHRFTAAELSAVEDAWRSGGIDAVVVMSVASLDGLLHALPPACLRGLETTRLVGPSERVIQTALERLPGVLCVQSPGPGASDVVDALVASLHRDPDPRHDPRHD